MNLVTFGFSEKGSPIILNQEPYTQVGTMYLMKSGDNSVIGITLDEKLLAKATGKAVRSTKTKTVTTAAPKKRGPKAKTEATAAPEKKAKKPGRPKVKKEKVVKADKAENKVEETVQ